MSHIKRTLTRNTCEVTRTFLVCAAPSHMRSNTFLACAAPFHTWTITRKAGIISQKVCLVSLTSVPLKGRNYFVSDWLSMVL